LRSFTSAFGRWLNPLSSATLKASAMSPSTSTSPSN
jgi:hypothetical protein